MSINISTQNTIKTNYHQTTTQKLPQSERTFDAVMNQCDSEQKEMICSDIQIINGKVMGLSNGKWEDLNPNSENRQCGPNEILVVGESLVVIGINIIKNFGMRMGEENHRRFAIQKNQGFDQLPNSLGLVPGKRVTLADGTLLEWFGDRVAYKPRPSHNQFDATNAENYAKNLARTMEDFTLIANNQKIGLGDLVGISKERTADVDMVLSAMGVNTREVFSINGKEFHYDVKSGEYNFELQSSVDGDYNVRYLKNDTKIKFIPQQENSRR